MRGSLSGMHAAVLVVRSCSVVWQLLVASCHSTPHCQQRMQLLGKCTLPLRSWLYTSCTSDLWAKGQVVYGASGIKCSVGLECSVRGWVRCWLFLFWCPCVHMRCPSGKQEHIAACCGPGVCSRVSGPPLPGWYVVSCTMVVGCAAAAHAPLLA